MASLSSRGTHWEQLRQQVLQRDNFTCVYCGREATEADHVLAKANGGKDELINLVASCRPCNGGKGARTNVRLNWYDNDWLDAL